MAVLHRFYCACNVCKACTLTDDWNNKLELPNLPQLDYIGNQENSWHSQETTWHSIKCTMCTSPERHSHRNLSLVRQTLRLKCTNHSDQEVHDSTLCTMKFITFNTWHYMYLDNYKWMQFPFGRFALQVYIYLRMVVQSMCNSFEQGCQVFLVSRYYCIIVWKNESIHKTDTHNKAISKVKHLLHSQFCGPWKTVRDLNVVNKHFHS